MPPRRGVLGRGRGLYALGLDRDKRSIDSLTSNLGHLLGAESSPNSAVL